MLKKYLMPTKLFKLCFIIQVYFYSKLKNNKRRLKYLVREKPFGYLKRLEQHIKQYVDSLKFQNLVFLFICDNFYLCCLF